MSFRDWLRNLIAGPPHISGGGDEAAEVADDLDEEMPVAAEDVDSLERDEEHGAGLRLTDTQFRPDIGPFEEAETAHEEKKPEGTPPDPNA